MAITYDLQDHICIVVGKNLIGIVLQKNRRDIGEGLQTILWNEFHHELEKGIRNTRLKRFLLFFSRRNK